MTPTPELRTRLRKLLNEVIPAGKTESDTRFLDSDLDTLLTEARNVYGAAAAGWTEKAAKLQDELGRVEGYSLGQEKYNLTSLKDALDYALKMAATYAEMGRVGSGSRMAKVTLPEVI